MPTALITGTSTGIGFATTVALADAGFDVAAGIRDPADAAPLREATEGVAGSIDVVRIDVDDDESVAAAFAHVGPLDALVNNAGLSPALSVEEFSIAQWKALLETNVFGVIRCTQAALPAMRERRAGTIVNISSIAGRVVMPMFGPYSTSKMAVEAMTEALAMEVRPFGVRAVLVEPGAVVTPIRAKTGMPPRESPYRPVAKNWGFAVGHDHARARGPEEVAATVLAAIQHPDPPLRHVVGQGCAETIELRSRHSDEAWRDLWSAETGVFLTRYHALTGIDLTEAP